MLNYVRQFIKIRVVFHTLHIWNEDGDPHFFRISGTSNSLSDCSKNFKKIYRVENFARTSLKLLLSVQSKIQKILQSISEETWHLFSFLRSLNLQRKGGEVSVKARTFIRNVWSAVDEVHCVTAWGSSSVQDTARIVQLFVWYFRHSRNLNYAILTQGDKRHQYGISGRESQTSSFAFRTWRQRMGDGCIRWLRYAEANQFKWSSVSGYFL